VLRSEVNHLRSEVIGTDGGEVIFQDAHPLQGAALQSGCPAGARPSPPSSLGIRGTWTIAKRHTLGELCQCRQAYGEKKSHSYPERGKVLRSEANHIRSEVKQLRSEANHLRSEANHMLLRLLRF
jgi:hypothetical protein